MALKIVFFPFYKGIISYLTNRQMKSKSFSNLNLDERKESKQNTDVLRNICQRSR